MAFAGKERAHYLGESSQDLLEDTGADLAETLGYARHYPEDYHDQNRAHAMLWRAVLRQVWLDAFSRDGEGPGRGEAAESRVDANRAEARTWLCSDIPEFAEDREWICRAAGVDPERVRTLAQEKLEQAKAEEAAEYEAEEQAERQAQNQAADSRHRHSKFRADLMADSLLSRPRRNRLSYAAAKPTQKPAPVPGLPVA